MIDIEVYALRYSARPECTSSEAFYRQDLYGEPVETIGMDYFLWAVRSQGSTVVVDCGFSEQTAQVRNREIQTHPAELLARVGVDLASVDHVVLSHMHFDHVGNTHLFPNALFHMARAEFDYWTGPHRGVPALSWPVEDSDVRAVEALHRDQRLELVDDFGRLGDSGVSITRFPGHSPGQVVTEVEVGDTKLMLAADAAHYYDEIRRNRPFYVFTDLEQMLGSYASLRALDARPDVSLIPGHDPLVSLSYEEVEPDCFDLTSPLD